MIKNIKINLLIILLCGCVNTTEDLDAQIPFKYKYSNYFDIKSDAIREDLSVNNKNEKIKKESINSEFKAHKSFPKNFKGDSIVNLIKDFDKIITISYDEFSKKSEVEDKLMSIKYRQYVFLLDRLNTLTKYNADKEKLNINMYLAKDGEFLGRTAYFYISLLLNSENKKYLGMNSFGVTANIDARYFEEYGVFLDLKQEQKDMYESNADLFNEDISIDVQHAKVLKEDIQYYVVVDFEKLEPKLGYLWEHTTTKNPTFLDPNEKREHLKCLLGNLIEAGAYKKSTGEVLYSKLF